MAVLTEPRSVLKGIGAASLNDRCRRKAASSGNLRLSCSFRLADIECGLSCLPAAAGGTAEAAAGKAAAPASAEAAAMRAGTRGNRCGGHGSLE